MEFIGPILAKLHSMPPMGAPAAVGASGARRTPSWTRGWGKIVQWSMKAWSRKPRRGDLLMHVGVANPRRWENVPGIPGACTNRNFTYLARGPCHNELGHHWLRRWLVACSSQTSTRTNANGPLETDKLTWNLNQNAILLFQEIYYRPEMATTFSSLCVNLYGINIRHKYSNVYWSRLMMRF